MKQTMPKQSSFICIELGGEGVEKLFEVTPSKTSENALLQNRMYLLSSVVFLV